MTSSQNVFVLYVEYGDKNTKSLERIQPLAKKLFPNFNVNICIVDNLNTKPEKRHDSFYWLQGDNKDREFSGWERGLEHYKPSIGDSDIVFILNDTFAINYGDKYLNWIDTDTVQAALNQGKVIGCINRYLRPVQLLGHGFDRWIRSSFIILRYSELKRVLPLNPVLPTNQLFAQSGPSLFQSNAPLCLRLRQYLDCWLHFGKAVRFEYDYNWHSARELDSSTRGFLIEKCRMIFFELLLSSRFQDQKIAFFDVLRSPLRAYGTYAHLDYLGLFEPLQNLIIRAKLFVRAVLPGSRSPIKEENGSKF